MNELHFDAVIDIKEILECNMLQADKNRLVIGSAVTLTRICEANLFPFLTIAARVTADHTSRSKITIGGNICETIPYHEALLPFLLCDSQAILSGRDGQRTVPVIQVFDQRFKMKKGELLVHILTYKSCIDLPYDFTKRTKKV